MSPLRSGSEILHHCCALNDGVCVSVTMTNYDFRFPLRLLLNRKRFRFVTTHTVKLEKQKIKA